MRALQKLLREAEAAIQNAIATCVQGVAQAAGAVCQALEANPALALMDLRLRHLPVGAGVAPLVQVGCAADALLVDIAVEEQLV